MVELNLTRLRNMSKKQLLNYLGFKNMKDALRQGLNINRVWNNVTQSFDKVEVKITRKYLIRLATLS